MARPRKELPRNERYGHLTVLGAVMVVEGKSQTRFKCDCGKITIKVNDDVVRGKTRSCGCLLSKSVIDMPRMRSHKDTVH